MDEGTGEENRLNTIIAILIALIVVTGAYISWRASLNDDAAGDTDYAGLRTAIFAEKTRALNYVNAYESYGSYVTYWRNNRLATLIDEALLTATAEQTPALEAEISAANDLADATRPMFKTRYLNRDGSYNVQRQIGEMWADAARKRELNYDAQFIEADRQRQKTLKLLLALMVLSISPVFYSLVEPVSKRLKPGMLVLGSFFALSGIILAILVGNNLI